MSSAAVETLLPSHDHGGGVEWTLVPAGSVEMLRAAVH